MKKVCWTSLAVAFSSLSDAQLVIYNGLNPSITSAGYLSLDGGSNFEGQSVGSETGELITDSVGATNIIGVEGQFVLDPEGSTTSGDTAVLVQVYNFANGEAGSLVGSQLVTHPRETDINDLFTPFGSGFTEADIIANVKIFGLVPGNQYIVAMQQQTPDADFLGAVTLNGDMDVQVPAGRPDAGYPFPCPPYPEKFNVCPSSIVGLPGSPIVGIRLENISIRMPGGASPSCAFRKPFDVPERKSVYPEFSMFAELPCWAIYLRHVRGIAIHNLKLILDKPDYRPAFVADDAGSLSFRSVVVKGADSTPTIIVRKTVALIPKGFVTMSK